MMNDSYLTVSKASEGLYKEKGSKFIAYVRHAKSTDDIQKHLESIHKLHPKSRHVCYAYRIGLDGNSFRINDDGEPSGSAGRPIYNQIQSKNITDVLIAVVRYFGGTKLGVPGLINAYKTSAKEAIEANQIVEKYVSNTYTIEFEYTKMGELLNVLKKLNINILEKNLTAEPSVKIEIRASKAEEQLILAKAKLLNLPLEMVNDKTTLDGISIKAFTS